jgi:CDP-glycerol glycerophosphotransferase
MKTRRQLLSYDPRMGSPRQPTLSVIVPIYNVGSYLAPCLDSILASSLTDIEIVCVDDGSTDGSGELADDYVARDSRVQVMHVVNGGLGRARNLGAVAAHGRYLAFADSDDRVPENAYALMCESLDASGSDFATGRVRRFEETRVFTSPMHDRAIRFAARGTHISRTPSLLYDTTAWNKVFRRTFWDANRFQFPEGVVYEDICLMISAHVLATAVDIIRLPIYDWRVRGDGSLSITQRRGELSNMTDRFTAIHSLTEFLIGHGEKSLLRAYMVKVLTIDFPLYLGVLNSVDGEYQLAFMKNVQRVLTHVDEKILYDASPWNNVALELLRRGRLDETLKLVEQRRVTRGEHEIKRRGARIYADLPYFRDRAVGVPDVAYDVANRLPVKALVEQLEMTDEELVVRGYAFISRVHLDHPWSAVRYLVLRSNDADQTIKRIMRPRRRPDVTADFGTELGGYDYAGFETRIPLSELKVGAGDEATYTIQAKIATLGARRGVPLGALDRAYLRKGPIGVTAAGDHVAVYESDSREVRVAVARAVPTIETVVVDAESDSITCAVRLPRELSGATRMSWQCQDQTVSDVTADLSVSSDDDTLCTATFAGAEFHRLPDGAADRLWQATLEVDGAGTSRQRSIMGPRTVPRVQLEDGEIPRELAVRIGRNGRLTLIDRSARCRVDELELRDGTLKVGLTVPPSLVRRADDLQYSLRNDAFGHIAPESISRDGRTATMSFAVLDTARGRALPPVYWILDIAESEAESAAKVRLELGAEPIAGGEQEIGDDATSASLIVQDARVMVRVRSGREQDRGLRNQHLLRTRYYPKAREQPLRDVVLFQSWGGKEYSCNPRAIYEEMRRQGRAESALWVRRDTSVEIPDGASWVLRGSREYYDALATARRIVTNDVLPPYYTKRAGSSYLQTWRGTPLKRIGFDVESLTRNSPRQLADLAHDVSSWDRLISPNAYSTRLFREAFRYTGTVLETGYPRNDVFSAPNVEELRSGIRQRLGLAPDQRVLLWAPTWRDDQRDEKGRYWLPMPFELSTWDRILGPNDVLLFRGHQLLRETSGGMLRGLRSVRNVTHYPDIQELYLAADVLITDYSSAMFDFANTGRPMIFYAWDLDTYRDTVRGFYFDFEKEAPGRLVTDLGGLHDAIRDIDATPRESADRYARFVEKFCALDDGKAAARVVDAMFDDR